MSSDWTQKKVIILLSSVIPAPNEFKFDTLDVFSQKFAFCQNLLWNHGGKSSQTWPFSKLFPTSSPFIQDRCCYFWRHFFWLAEIFTVTITCYFLPNYSNSGLFSQIFEGGQTWGQNKGRSTKLWFTMVLQFHSELITIWTVNYKDNRWIVSDENS
jgi:hypothetical protein